MEGEGVESYKDQQGRVQTRKTLTGRAADVAKTDFRKGGLGDVTKEYDKAATTPKPKLSDPGIDGDTIKWAKALAKWRTENQAHQEAQRAALDALGKK